jgi:hypothetical protein
MKTNLIVFITTTLFIAQSTALRVNCDFRNATWTFSTAYTCFGDVIDNNNQEILEVVNENQHQPGMTNDNVEGFFIRNQPVSHLPLNLGWKFRALKGFECDNCNLTNVRSSHLERLTNLIHLALPRNRIKKLPGNFFRFTINLQWVYFHNNELASAGLNVLKNLRSLRGFYLANNGCVSDNAVQERGRFLSIMHSLVSKCTPDLDDFVTDTENTECTFTEETSNENPPKDSSSSSTSEKKNTKENFFDGLDF